MHLGHATAGGPDAREGLREAVADTVYAPLLQSDYLNLLLAHLKFSPAVLYGDECGGRLALIHAQRYPEVGCPRCTALRALLARGSRWHQTPPADSGGPTCFTGRRGLDP